MKVDALIAPGFFAVACEVQTDQVTASIAWTQPQALGQVLQLSEPKQDPIVKVRIPTDLASLHTEVILNVEK